MRKKSDAYGGEDWVVVSDLMSGLMLVFLAIAVFFMIRMQSERQNVVEVALVYDSVKTKLYQELEREFRPDLPIWGAEIDQVTLSVRFDNPEVLFQQGDSTLTPRFTEILDDFFPRYVRVLTAEPFRGHIEEVRIEGHTSSDWRGLTGLEAYQNNMALSQTRTRSVLNYVVRLGGVAEHWEGWLRVRLTANGLSSSKPMFRAGEEDRARSRRVEFRVRTDADERLGEIVRQVGR